MQKTNEKGEMTTEYANWLMSLPPREQKKHPLNEVLRAGRLATKKPGLKCSIKAEKKKDTCIMCDAQYEPHRKKFDLWQKAMTCSKECEKQAYLYENIAGVLIRRNAEQTKECITCGTTIVRGFKSNHSWSRTKYCSRPCEKGRQTKPPTPEKIQPRKCKLCENLIRFEDYKTYNIFEKRKYCSDKCSKAGHQIAKRKRQKKWKTQKKQS